jgi:hypothetical protein
MIGPTALFSVVVCEAEGALPLGYVAFAVLAIFRFLRKPH